MDNAKKIAPKGGGLFSFLGPQSMPTSKPPSKAEESVQSKNDVPDAKNSQGKKPSEAPEGSVQSKNDVPDAKNSQGKKPSKAPKSVPEEKVVAPPKAKPLSTSYKSPLRKGK